MSALRWAGALMLTVCGWCAGDALAQKLQAEVDALEETVHLLEDIREEIAFRRQDLGQLCARLTQKGRLRTQSNTMQTALPPSALGRREAGWFRECFAGLGRTEAEQECQRLEQYRDATAAGTGPQTGPCRRAGAGGAAVVTAGRKRHGH